MDEMNNFENEDLSLSVPWIESKAKMEKEIDTYVSIHEKNLKEFEQLKGFILKMPLLDLDVQYPAKKGHCGEAKKRYLEENNKTVKALHQLNDKYNALVEKAHCLQQEVNIVEKKLKRVAPELTDYEQKRKKAKAEYTLHKSALNVAKKLYDSCFDMEITIDEECDDSFKAKVVFNQKKDFPITFTINRSLNKIIDFEAGSSLSENDLEELKKYKDTNNTLALICSMRKIVLNK